MRDMNNPFLVVPWDATPEQRAELAKQAEKQGRSLAPGIEPSQAGKTIAAALARTDLPEVDADNRGAFLDNLDAIAAGRVRVVRRAVE